MAKTFFTGFMINHVMKTRFPLLFVQISENGTFPFSFFRITKTRIRKFSILSLTDHCNQPEIMMQPIGLLDMGVKLYIEMLYYVPHFFFPVGTMCFTSCEGKMR